MTLHGAQIGLWSRRGVVNFEMKDPVYIVLATYNGAKYISQQLDSILAQSWPCYICVFDDCSTDGTAELIQSTYLKYDNIHLTINDNQLGFVKNFEQGIKAACDLGAAYIALSDQDDIWHTERLERMMTILLKDNTQLALVYSDLKMIDDVGKIIHPSYLKYRRYNTRTHHPLAVALGQNGVMGNTILMNRSLAKQVLPFPENLYAHDYWISLVAQLYGKCLYLPCTLVSYRIHGSNVSNSVQSLASGKSTRSLWQQFCERDHLLPYMEDSRVQLLESAILPAINSNESAYNANISQHDEALIRGFMRYLNLQGSRWYLAYWMLKHGFIKNDLGYKIRFIYKIVRTTRYTDPKS